MFGRELGTWLTFVAHCFNMQRNGKLGSLSQTAMGTGKTTCDDKGHVMNPATFTATAHINMCRVSVCM